MKKRAIVSAVMVLLAIMPGCGKSSGVDGDPLPLNVTATITLPGGATGLPVMLKAVPAGMNPDTAHILGKVGGSSTVGGVADMTIWPGLADGNYDAYLYVFGDYPGSPDLGPFAFTVTGGANLAIDPDVLVSVFNSELAGWTASIMIDDQGNACAGPGYGTSAALLSQGEANALFMLVDGNYAACVLVDIDGSSSTTTGDRVAEVNFALVGSAAVVVNEGAFVVVP